MMMLCLLALVSLSAFSAVSDAGIIRVERDVCVEVHKKFETCTSQAYEDYKAAHEAGEDGRPDWLARKSCNYMTAAVEDCGNMLIGVCNTEDEVTKQKDQQLKGILAQLSSSIAEWDSEKCPAVKAHIDRMKGEKTEIEDVAEKEDTCDEVVVKFNSCTMQAYEDYKAANEAGEDGRPDWLARKSCNYMTAGVEDCGNILIGVCNTKEDVTASKDSQLKSILAQLQTSVDKWDSEKCPAVKAHIDRMKGDEDRNLAWILEKIYQLFGGLVTFISSL